MPSLDEELNAPLLGLYLLSRRLCCFNVFKTSKVPTSKIGGTSKGQRRRRIVLSHIFPSYTLGQLNIFNFFLYNFIDNSRKYDWKEWDSSKSMKDQFFHS